MVREDRRFGNLDPSRFLRNDGSDTVSAGRDDPVAPPYCAGSGGWRRDAGAPALENDTTDCSSAGRDRNRSRPQTAKDSPDCRNVLI